MITPMASSHGGIPTRDKAIDFRKLQIAARVPYMFDERYEDENIKYCYRALADQLAAAGFGLGFM